VNNSDQKERAQVIKDTYHNRYQDESGGRFAKSVPTNVIGSSPVSYPRLPQSSPWAAPDPSGQEQPYPLDLSEPPEPVGTHQEIQDSLQPFSWLRGDRPSTAPVCAGDDDTEAIRAHDPADQETVDRVKRHSPTVSKGRHPVRRSRVSPNNPSIRRRVF
jgi:hypothetical protein